MNTKFILILLVLIISTIFVNSQSLNVEVNDNTKDVQDWHDACKVITDEPMCLAFIQHCEWTKGHCKAWL
ncbi:hypothetical protein DDB_G0272238 [Dictyostelium discoideum AX4]|uniref:Uncharacterized protein DDB_G0272238 n=1 Tax=Dictyostelium discoideum TaxID=44689 RepID=Y2085_DICDI|nr:hypothetical protein DDB_G0272238 [Dictyostelium discoideum AX4]Q75JQ0.1 RecName: Full=Uncharacterized protein DDB_G0272238; Flags: Precursor [Dictyostelium discoideum]EAL71271.1 hypothetical protein DDB_G0272238 [Dictyostelium discoideum AX4]|eukprot:XP_645307.1 hypothetical protein DDB_G0272238 [Dictyostelium discoideum AX4]